MKSGKCFTKVNDLLYYLFQIYFHLKRRDLKDTAEVKSRNSWAPRQARREEFRDCGLWPAPEDSPFLC